MFIASRQLRIFPDTVWSTHTALPAKALSKILALLSEHPDIPVLASRNSGSSRHWMVSLGSEGSILLRLWKYTYRLSNRTFASERSLTCHPVPVAAQGFWFYSALVKHWGLGICISSQPLFISYLGEGVLISSMSCPQKWPHRGQTLKALAPLLLLPPDPPSQGRCCSHKQKEKLSKRRGWSLEPRYLQAILPSKKTDWPRGLPQAPAHLCLKSPLEATSVTYKYLEVKWEQMFVSARVLPSLVHLVRCSEQLLV